ncbi:MAG: tetratricopeptide repeat protein [Nitrospinales bacterium]
MRPPQRILLFLSLATLLILPQCVEKTSNDYVQEGIANSRDGNYAQAMESFLMAIEADKKNPQAYVGLGGIYNQKKMYDRAVEVFNTALRIDPTYVDAYYSLGYSYEMMGDMEQAEKRYRKYRSLKKRLDDLVNRGEREDS